MVDPILENEQNSQTGKPSFTPVLPQSTDESEYEYVPLPSRGVYYTGPWKNKTHILVRKLNWEDEDILTTQSFYDNGTLFEELLKRVVIDDSAIKAKDLINADRQAILWYLRLMAFGQEYTVIKTCGNCGKTNEVSWDLTTFQLPDFPKEYEEELQKEGCVTLELPQSKLLVKIAIPSYGKEALIRNELTKLKEKEKKSSDLNVTGRLLSCIIEAKDKEGNVYQAKKGNIKEWLEKSKISIMDSRYIRKKVEEISLDVDTSINTKCEHCKYEEEGVRMPMSTTFFWPES